jgi:phage-related baseplate assembly protein
VSAILIPAGTRATADNVIYFATDSNLIINAGQLSGTVSATSLQAGAAANNIGIGEVNTIVDPVPYVASVANTEITLGGRDTELDDAYRERIYNAPAVFSIAGPRDAYIYLAKSASSAIGEVTVTSDMAGTVNVYPLLTNGEIPNSAILEQVRAALNPNTVRPLADHVVVSAPEVVTYNINLTYYVYTDDAGNVGNIQNAVNAAIDGWILWQRQKIGRDINVSELIKRIMEAGAKRVVMNLPINTVVLPNQLAVNNSKTITFGGLEDE